MLLLFILHLKTMNPNKFRGVVAVSAIVLLSTGGIAIIAAMLIYYGGKSSPLFEILYIIELVSGVLAIFAITVLLVISAVRLHEHLKDKKA